MSKKTVTHINLVGGSAIPASSRKRKVAAKKAARKSKSRGIKGKGRGAARNPR
jgi:hypothetical protein